MKKLLVVLMAAMMVLSLAAVSMAAATVEGDWRVEWVKAGDNDLTFKQNDLRLNFKGKVSDSVDAYMQYTFGSATSLKEYYVTFKQDWGKAQVGLWDYKLVPSRVILKPHGDLNCRNQKAMQFLFEIPVGDALTFGLWMVPDAAKTAGADPTKEFDNMTYDVKAAYKADSFGTELHFGSFNDSGKVGGVSGLVAEGNYIAFDVYYNINDNIKAFVYGVNADKEIKGWVEELAPIVGATFKTGKLTSSIEYALEETSKDYTQYALQFKYGFTNKVNLEVEYTNINKDDNQIVIRPRVKF
jgi:hypothetical protein